MRFFKVANKIFDYPLSPNGFMVYTYLLSRVNVFQTVVVSYQTIAEDCRIDQKTAARAVRELIQFELLVKENRYNFLGYAKNKYTVKKLNGGWFKVEYSILHSKMKSSDYMVYCFIHKCMDAKAAEAFPSLSAIAKGTGISRSRVAVAVRHLREYTYLNRVKRHYRKTGAYRQNRYLKFRLSPKKKKVRSHKRTSFVAIEKSFPISIINRRNKNVKHFLLFKGSLFFPKQLLDPQSTQLRKKEYYTLSKLTLS